MKSLKATAAALVVGLFLVMATDYIALAANGKPLILGQLNKASRVTIVKSSKTTAAKFVSPSTKPPIAVSNSRVVAKLNADLVDGKSASQLASRAYQAFFPLAEQSGTLFALEMPTVPPGKYLATYSAYTEMNTTIASPETISCYLSRVGEKFYTGETVTNSNDGALGASGAGVVALSGSQSLQLVCAWTNSRTFKTFSTEPIEISLTRLDEVVDVSPPVVLRQAPGGGDPVK